MKPKFSPLKNLRFRPIEKKDWPRISEIYALGITTGNATFQEEIPSWENWNKTHIIPCRILVEIDTQIIGWAALSLVSSRYVYRGVSEISIYIDPCFSGKKIGVSLLQKLILASEKQGFWTLQAGIFPENTASLTIHKHLGFRTIGKRERVGKLKGVWRDTVLLERRSLVIGVDS